MARQKKQPEPTFKEISQLAAEIERAGNYKHAKSLWQKAYTLAKRPVNIAWCQSRVAFLERWESRLCNQ